jgi:hypothetical protein
LRSPALISACLKTGCYAVLASLSERYPPLEGRSPTRYSPVCHSIGAEAPLAFDLHVLGTPPALILSQDQTLMFKGVLTVLPEGTRLAADTMGQLSHKSRLDGSALSLRQVRWFPPDPIGPSRDRPDPARHPLILDGLAVTFYLVFKEPAVVSGGFLASPARIQHARPSRPALSGCF